MATPPRGGPCRWTARCHAPSRTSISRGWPDGGSSLGCTATAAPPALAPPAAARSLRRGTARRAPTAEVLMELLLFTLVLALAYANGTNDVSKAIATLVGSGVTDYRTAILWGTIWTTVGAAVSGIVAGAMLNTFSTGLIQPGIAAPPALAGAVLFGAIAWVLVASRTGLPVSTTHALTGALVGAGLVAIGSDGLTWSAITQKIALPLLLSPVLALSLSLVLHPVIRFIAGRWEGTCLCVMPESRALVTIDERGNTRTLFQTSALGQPVVAVPSQCDRAGLRGVTIGLDTIHWISSGLTSLARGINDAPKILAMLLLGGALASWPSEIMKVAAFAGAALAMGLGSFIGGDRGARGLGGEGTRQGPVGRPSAHAHTAAP